MRRITAAVTSLSAVGTCVLVLRKAGLTLPTPPSSVVQLLGLLILAVALVLCALTWALAAVLRPAAHRGELVDVLTFLGRLGGRGSDPPAPQDPEEGLAPRRPLEQGSPPVEEGPCNA